MTLQELQELQSLLNQEKTRLEQELASFAAPDPKMRGDWDTIHPAVSTLAATMPRPSPDERADIREEFETELAQEQSLEARLDEVNRALERMRAGTFGRCRGCGELIGLDRLRANPAAEYDMRHQPRG